MTAAANSIDDKGDTAGGALVSRHYESTTKTIAQRDRGTEEYRRAIVCCIDLAICLRHAAQKPPSGTVCADGWW